MLSEEERKEIESEILRSREKRGALLEAMRIVQKHRGWVSDEIHDTAEMLGMTAAELDSVATFYSLIFRKPVGKHVILVCDTVSCWLTGYEKILDRLTRRLGMGMNETSADGQFTLLAVACLGVCDRAPAMMVDEELYTDLTPEKVDEILDHYQ
jgi:NADH-quinone oxidoreductase subunit E